MNIDSIKNGYVIDHIKAGNAMKIYELMNLNKLDSQVAIISSVVQAQPMMKNIRM